jgi:hypothetical protein
LSCPHILLIILELSRNYGTYGLSASYCITLILLFE